MGCEDGTRGDHGGVGRVNWFECRLGLCDVVARARSMQRSATRIELLLSGPRGIQTLLSRFCLQLGSLEFRQGIPADDIIAFWAWISSNVFDLLRRSWCVVQRIDIGILCQSLPAMRRSADRPNP
jgi:hypothetical protein